MIVTRRIAGLALCLMLGMTSVGEVLAQTYNDCGSLENAYGPFDYTNPEHFAKKLPIVEDGHFDLGVEQLEGHMGKSNGFASLAGDIDYTLRAFPNHHRAIYTMIRYYTERVAHGAAKMRFSAECYFDRAIRFAPDDATIRMLHGVYLHKVGKPAASRAAYEVALKLAPNSAEVNYNAGLMYAELREYDLAVKHAQRAYELGYPLQGLRNKLRRLGVWPAETQAARKDP